MIPKAIDAKYSHGFTIFIRFDDGTEGHVDLSQELYGEFFTLCWPNGADLAPEFLVENIKVPA